MKKFLSAVFIIAVVCTLCGAERQAKEVKWNTNYAVAQKMAAEKKIPILMLFSGSDWCPPCIMLDNNVLKTLQFAEFAASGKAVLFHADFPRRKKQPHQLTVQNNQLMEKYQIQGVPSIVLTDAAGKEFARTGYRPGTVEKYIEHLEELLKKAPAK